MKTRILSAAVGLLILGIVYVFLDTMLLNVAIGLVCVLAVVELLTATGCMQFKGLVALAMLMTVVIPFARAGYVRLMIFEAVYFLVIAFFIVLLKNNQRMTIEQFAMTFAFSTIIPVFFSCAVYIRDDYGVVAGGFYLLMALGTAWLCDTGAYFTGTFLGKRKLAPNISPKKTVEGAIGGVIFAAIAMLAIGAGYSAAMAAQGTPIAINYLTLAVFTPIFSVIGMLGDLSASVIKRHYRVKDFGHIMPGHGGVLDRFDSVLFTLPAVYILSSHISLVSVL